MNLQNFEVPSGAQYTEFLRDYLKTNELPASLHGADTVFEIDFLETFKNYFYMREIGFHTEEMFKQKLAVQVDIMIPYYKEKATDLKLLFNQIFENGFSITQTNNLANSETATINRDASNSKTVAHDEENTLDDTTTQTNNLKEVLTRGEDTIEKEYRTPLGSQTGDLSNNSLAGGKTSNVDEDATKDNTGTVTTVKDATNTIDIDETTTDTIDETVAQAKTGTNTGTVTTVYSKNPRYNSIEALKTFQDNFKNIIEECLKSFDCLFMQIF